MPITPLDLEGVDSFGRLAELFNHKLDWPLDRWPLFTGVRTLYEINDPAVQSIELLAAVQKLTDDDQWGILLLDFQDQPLKRGVLRKVLNAVATKERPGHDNPTWLHHNILFICRSKGNQWTFAHFRGEKLAGAELKTFSWTDPKRTRTVCKMNLPKLDWQVQEHWDRAWDVSAVTQKFYEEFDEIFKRFEPLIALSENEGPPYRSVPFPAGEARTLYLQSVMNRLLFICFLQQKEWLRFQGSERDYLFQLYDAWKANPGGRSFSNLLRILFFQGLNEEDGAKRRAASKLIGEVPFLNGGLFHQGEFERDEEATTKGIAIAPDGLFDELLGQLGLFRNFNFTVIENYDESDQDVAVDPEMLGRVFEELVTGRHETGSYYTPRPVVSFMCKQALKKYLGGHEDLIEKHVGTGIDIPAARELLEKLEAIKVLDPACGSGAYLLGMLQEVFQIQRALDTRAQKLNDRDDYERKLLIIQRCLYGADLDQFAVNISHLRLWLALLIEDKRNPLEQPDEPVALPNLRFKVAQGDALTARIDDLSLFEVGYRKLARELAEYHDEYFAPPIPGEDRRSSEEIEVEIDRKQEEIVKVTGSMAPEGALNWQVQFAEVFAHQGFDVVLANPPYVRADAQFKHMKVEKDRQTAITEWKKYRKGLKDSSAYATLHEKWDLYIPFLERAHQLLAPGGQMVFIIPDAYNTAKYAGRSHQYFLEASTIERIDFCSEIPLFSAGVFNTILHFRRNEPGADHTPVRARRFGKVAAEFEAGIDPLPSGPQAALGARLFRSEIATVTTTSPTMPLANICYISAGMVIHADEKGHAREFSTDEVLADFQDETYSKRFVLGKDLAKWQPRRIRYLEWGTSRAPSQFRRPTFPELQNAREKILALRTPGQRIRLLYDDDCLHFDASSVGFVPWHILSGVRNKSIQKTALYTGEQCRTRPRMAEPREDLELLSKIYSAKYLLGIMNSSPGATWMAAHRKNKMHIFPDDWREFPIPRASDTDRAEVEALVQRILDLKSREDTDRTVAALRAGTSDDIDVSSIRALHGEQDIPAQIATLEAEIDARVEFLYFHASEAPDYDAWMEQKEKERGTAIEEIRNLIAAKESGTVEFKQSLEYVDPADAELLKAPEGEPRQKKRRAAMDGVVHSALKTVCAFVNSRGGTLLIGVHDKEGPVGIEPDIAMITKEKDRDEDGFERKLRDLLDSRLNKRPLQLIEVSFAPLDGKVVCRVDVTPSSEPFYLDGEYFVRDGNRTIPLIDHERDDYIAKRRAAELAAPARRAGDVHVSGLRAGDGREADGGSVTVKGGTGRDGADGGSVFMGPGQHKAGDGGTTGKGGDLTIKGGDAE